MSIPDCSITEYTITVYPGETFTVPGVAVGQKFGTVPFITVHSNFVSTEKGRLPELQYTQLVNANCTSLTYTVLSSPKRTEVIKLTVEKHSIPPNIIINKALKDLQVTETLINLQFSELTIHVKLKPCPSAFVFDNNSQTCICSPKLQQHKVNCSISTQTVYRRSPLWIIATFLNETYTQVLVHNHCPFDYTARMETFNSTWNTQMNSVPFLVLVFCVDHANRISAMSWGPLTAKNAAHIFSCLFLSLLLQELF